MSINNASLISLADEFSNVLNTTKAKHNVKRIGVFGSFARGDNNKNSDIDIVIDYEYGEGLLESATNYAILCDNIRTLVANKHGVNTDIIEFLPLSYSENKVFAEAVKKDVVWLYEHNKES